jgi:hypothetical protein
MSEYWLTDIIGFLVGLFITRYTECTCSRVHPIAA